jgi:hypothetical protein
MQVPFSNTPSVVRETSAGVLEMWIDRRGWLLSRMRGRFELAHCTTMMATGDEAIRLSPRLRFVHDWRDLTGFDLSVPPHLVAWAAKNVRSVEHSTIVCRSPMVAMAAHAANLTLKNMLFVSTDPAALDRAFVTW